jgi:hypothetical protein
VTMVFQRGSALISGITHRDTAVLYTSNSAN